MPEPEDIIYINKTLSGDTLAYGKLVEKYKNKTYTLALRVVRHAEEAEEVSQDAFMKAYKALKGFKREATFSTWLYRIVYNTALTRLKKKRLDTTTIEDNHEAIKYEDFSNTMNGLLAADRKKYLTYALSQLAEDEAVMINLYYTHDKDMNEIADIMNMTHVNVRVKLSRVRKKLYQILQKTLRGELKNIV